MQVVKITITAVIRDRGYQFPMGSRLLSRTNLIAKLGLLVLDGKVGSRLVLVLLPDEVGDLLVFGLLDGVLVILRALL